MTAERRGTRPFPVDGSVLFSSGSRRAKRLGRSWREHLPDVRSPGNPSLKELVFRRARVSFRRYDRRAIPALNAH